VDRVRKKYENASDLAGPLAFTGGAGRAGTQSARCLFFVFCVFSIPTDKRKEW